MNSKQFLLGVMVLILSLFQINWLNPIKELAEKANQLFYEQKYDESFQEYNNLSVKIEPKENSPEFNKLHYNMANVFYKKGEYDKALEEYSNIIGSADDQLAFQTHYAMGNAYFKKEEYAKAIESYKKALSLNSTDQDAKYNLELARKRLKDQMNEENNQQNQQQQQENQEQQQQENQDQENQEQKNQEQQQQNQDQQQEEQEQEQNQQQNQEQEQQEQQNQDQQQQQQQQEQQQDNQQLTKEQVQQILDNLEQNEKDDRKMMRRKIPARGIRVEKDW